MIIEVIIPDDEGLATHTESGHDIHLFSSQFPSTDPRVIMLVTRRGVNKPEAVVTMSHDDFAALQSANPLPLSADAVHE